MKTIWIDTETTGLYPTIHGLIEIGYIIEIDGEEKERGNFFINPMSYYRGIGINEKALKINGTTIKMLDTYEDSSRVHEQFLLILSRYVDKFDKKDKFVIKGYNVGFDINFLKMWFSDCDDLFFNSWFSHKEVDVFALVKVLKDIKAFESENDKLPTLCKKFGIKLDAHKALDDIIATRELYKILVNDYICKEFEG